jgi:hypothetical protein
MKSNILCAFLLSGALLQACTEQGSTTFKSKEDSIRFARSVLANYPDALSDTSRPSVAPQGPGQGVAPINNQLMRAYFRLYDADPKLFTPGGQPYQGFGIDTAGWKSIKNNPKIFGLFMRLGRKPDSSYTIVLQGLDARGRIINNGLKDGAPKDTTNYDQVLDCPNSCP